MKVTNVPCIVPQVYVGDPDSSESSTLYKVGLVTLSLAAGGLVGWPLGVLTFCAGYFAPRLSSGVSLDNFFANMSSRQAPSPGFFPPARVVHTPVLGHAPRDREGHVLAGGRQAAPVAPVVFGLPVARPCAAPVRNNGQFDAQGNKMPSSR